MLNSPSLSFIFSQAFGLYLFSSILQFIRSRCCSFLLDLQNPLLIKKLILAVFHFSFLVCFLEKQIVACCCVVVLVCIDRFENIILFKVKFWHSIKHKSVYRDLRKPDEDATRDFWKHCRHVPRVFSNVCNFESFFGISLQDLLYHIFHWLWDPLWHFELPSKDFLVKISSNRIFKR